MTETDPTQMLNDLRRAAYVVSETTTEIPSVNRLVEGFIEFDDYLTDGGELPEQWQHSTVGRPRLVEEGRKLDLPEERHGKASTYNLGCRCFACREANRERAVRYRQNKKEQTG